MTYDAKIEAIINAKIEAVIKDSEDFLDVERPIAIQFIYKVMNYALREYKTLPKKDRDILAESLRQGM